MSCIVYADIKSQSWTAICQSHFRATLASLGVEKSCSLVLELRAALVYMVTDRSAAQQSYCTVPFYARLYRCRDRIPITVLLAAEFLKHFT